MSLPSGYTRVEYIESSGTQWVDTSFIPSGENMKIEFDFIYTAAHTNSSLCGTQAGTSSLTFQITIYGDQTAFYVGTSHNLLPKTFINNTRYQLSAHANSGMLTVSLGGTPSSSAYSGNLDKTLSLALFGNNINGSVSQLASVRLYSCKIYDNNVLVRDFIPCKNASGTVGLWDDVNSQFYQNAGTGTFTAGPVVLGSHKTMIGGTIYDVTAGKCMVGGTVYDIQKGLTMVGGTIYEIPLTVEPSIPVGTTWTITSSQSWEVPASGNYQVELHGGGGGGRTGGWLGYTSPETSYEYRTFSGGGGGGSGQLQMVALRWGESVAITIGAGGTGSWYEGTSVVSPSNGGASSFGAHFSVNGGGAGSIGGGSAAGNIATAGTSGEIVYSGIAYNYGTGGYGYASKPSQTYGNGGNGGQGDMYTSNCSRGSPGQPGACIITYLGT